MKLIGKGKYIDKNNPEMLLLNPRKMKRRVRLLGDRLRST